MHPKTIAKQVIGINKAALDSSFNTMNLWHGHAERMVQLYVDGASFFPEDGKKALVEWLKAYKKGREDYKTAVDGSLQNVEDFFIKIAENMEYSIYGMIEKADSSLSDFAHKIRNISVAVVNKSVQRIAGTPPTKDVQQKVAASVKKATKGKIGNSKANAVSKTVKKTVKK